MTSPRLLREDHLQDALVIEDVIPSESQKSAVKENVHEVKGEEDVEQV